MGISRTIKSWFGAGTSATGRPFDLIPPSVQPGWWQRNETLPARSGCPTVSACVDAYAQTIATLYGEHYRYRKDGGKDRITDSDLAKVFRKPNTYQTRSDLMMNLIRDLLYTGNAYLYAVRNEYGEIIQVHQIPSARIRPRVDTETREVWYSVGENVLEIAETENWVPASRIAHFRLHCPMHPLIGVSPIENAALAISQNQAIAASQAAFASNMSRPSGILMVDNMNMTSEQISQARAAWHAQSQYINAGGVPILPAHLKWQPLSLTTSDAQLLESFKLSSREIAKAFRVPLPLIGDYENATFSGNVEQLINLWLSTGLGFLLEHIEQQFDAFFDLPAGDFTEFDVQTLLRTDLSGRIDAMTKGISGGLYSVNEARQREGLPSVEFGDEPRLQAQVVPISQAEKVPVAPSAPVKPDVDPEMAKALALTSIRKAMNGN